MTEYLESNQNPKVQRLRRLVSTPNGYRDLQGVWIEGEHMVQEAVRCGLRLKQLIYTPSASEQTDWSDLWPQWLDSADELLCVNERLFRSISDLMTPRPIAAVLHLHDVLASQLDPDAPTVVLDRLQDVGNVGSIVRSARALGYTQVLALHGSAALASPKVMRAAQGAHMGMRLVEGLQPSDLAQLRVPLLATDLQGKPLHQDPLPWPCAWVMGNEGRGIAPEMASLCQQRLRIAMPGQFESLNVAAAAAICLYASAPK